MVFGMFSNGRHCSRGAVFLAVAVALVPGAILWPGCVSSRHQVARPVGRIPPARVKVGSPAHPQARARAHQEEQGVQLLRRWALAIRKASPRTPVDIAKLVQPPEMRDDEDLDAPIRRMTPDMEEEPRCALKVTEAQVVPTPALAAGKPLQWARLGFFVFPRRWAGMEHRKPGAVCFFGAWLTKGQGWEYSVERVFGLEPASVLATPPPQWKRRGRCLLVEVHTKVHERTPDDETTDARRVVVVVPGGEDLPWVARRLYSITEQSNGPNDATEQRRETGKWYRVNGKTIFVRTSTFSESGGAAVGRPYSRSGTVMSYLRLDERRCVLKEVGGAEVARLRKEPGGDRLPPEPPRPTTTTGLEDGP